MSNIAELANAPELSFINHMTLQETEELVREGRTVRSPGKTRK